ncbi:hypothetical protein BH23GEM4_BH23GEM4_00910 [soil metagenome]|jgi:hypothetical protein
MDDTSTVDLHLELPREVARAIREVQRDDPALLNRMVQYLVLRKTVFDTLAERAFREPSAVA